MFPGPNPIVSIHIWHGLEAPDKQKYSSQDIPRALRELPRSWGQRQKLPLCKASPLLHILTRHRACHGPYFRISRSSRHSKMKEDPLPSSWRPWMIWLFHLLLSYSPPDTLIFFCDFKDPKLFPGLRSFCSFHLRNSFPDPHMIGFFLSLGLRLINVISWEAPFLSLGQSLSYYLVVCSSSKRSMPVICELTHLIIWLLAVSLYAKAISMGFLTFSPSPAPAMPWT